MDKDQEQKLSLPICTVNNSRFYSSDAFPPQLFNVWRRTNGFSLPLHGYMLLSWIYYAVILLSLYMLLPPFFAFIYALTIPINTLLVASILLTMFIDPIHPGTINTDRNKNYIKTMGVSVINDDFCGICNVKVDGRGVKHCKSCNKCVAGFDHHCLFMSTCIGSNNYLFFSLSLIFGTAISGILAGLFTYCIYLFLTDRSLYESKELPLNPIPTFVWQCISLVLSLLPLAFFTHLSYFHIKLWIYNFSTIEYLEYMEARKWDKSGYKTDPTIPKKREPGRRRWERCGLCLEDDDDFDAIHMKNLDRDGTRNNDVETAK